MSIHRRVWVVGTLAGVLALVMPAGTAQQREVAPVERVAALTRPAIVYLEISWSGHLRDRRDGKLWLEKPTEAVFTCSGSVVDPDGFVLTAGHCVDDGPEGVFPTFVQAVVDSYVSGGQVKSEDADGFYETVANNSDLEGESADDPVSRTVVVHRGVIRNGKRAGDASTAEVLGFDPLSKGDIALVKIEKSGVPSILISDESDIGTGAPIVAIGYPGSVASITDATLEPTYKDGTVSANRTEAGVPFYEISAPTTPGMSGGPVVDLEGRVIGVTSHGPARETQSFNLIASISSAKAIFDKAGVKNELAPIDVTYRSALKQLFDHHYKAAVATFDRVIKTMPDHQQAIEIRREAAKRQSQERGGGFPMWIVLLLLVAGGGYFGFRRYTTKKAPAEAPTSAATPSASTPSVAPMAASQAVGSPAPVAGSAESHQCPRCGATNRTGVQFCTRCGNALDATAPAAVASGQPATSDVPTEKKRGSRNRLVGIGVLVLMGIVAVAKLSGSSGSGTPPPPNASTQPESTVALDHTIAGTWESNFGPVTIEHAEVQGDDPVDITGSWVQGPGKKGTITSGTFDPAKGNLKFNYVEDWSGVKGTANLNLSEDANELSGKWSQAGTSGDWFLTRRSDSVADEVFN